MKPRWYNTVQRAFSVRSRRTGDLEYSVAVTADDFRELALSLEDATEKSHMGHPDFRANGRIFSTLGPGETWGMVKLTPEEQKELMRLHPKAFSPASGAWGRQGCTTVHLEAADKRTVRGALLLAWQHVVDQPPARRPKKRKG
jgi:hypothetical protein